MELLDRFRENLDYQSDVVRPFDGSSTIRRIGLERSGIKRGYCAFFTADGTIRYVGEGRGLEGRALGKANETALAGVFRLIESLKIDSISKRYEWDGIEILPYPDSLFDSLILIDSTVEEKCILFDHGAMPPMFRVVTDLLDLLLDSAEWNKHDFFIQRDLSVKPPVKRKWG